ncbi:MAG: hypothetical protein E4H40_03970 [Candidatus Brocadiia bacterium]|nr:MAG: hypothetical protein E4H40_03970 [Candidatus Brocadiia bacterium]
MRKPVNIVGDLLSVKARDILETDFVWGDPDETLRDGLARLNENDADYLLVGRRGVLEGIVTRAEVTGQISPYLRENFAHGAGGEDDPTLKIQLKWIMHVETGTISEDAKVAEISKAMRDSGKIVLAAANGRGEITGVVSSFNVYKVKALVKVKGGVGGAAGNPAKANTAV